MSTKALMLVYIIIHFTLTKSIQIKQTKATYKYEKAADISNTLCPDDGSVMTASLKLTV